MVRNLLCSLLLLLFQNAGAFQISRVLSRRGVIDTVTVASPSTSTSLHLTTDPDAPSTNDDVPSMDWLTNSLSTRQEGQDDNDQQAGDMAAQSPYMEEHEGDGDLGDVPIPTTGISVSDEMGKTQQDRFFTELVPIKGLDKGVRAAQIVTTATAGSFEPVRYMIGLSKKVEEGADTADDKTTSKDDDDFVMMDAPPFSKQLKAEMQKYMGPKGRLSAILVTCRDSIHYNDAPGVFTIRRADLLKWHKAFPDTAIVAYRLDIPRDCRDSVTQRLDGYGPFALDETSSSNNVTFIETGRPLTYEAWDHDVTEDIFAGKQTPPDDDEVLVEGEAVEQDKDYSPEGIRSREEGKRVLAVFTPGRSYGSVSYIFPEIKLCASGFTVPVEDSRSEENMGLESAGPALDCRGYITTSRAGISRQMESARNLVNTYGDRFNVLLASGGDPFFLDGDTKERQQEVLDVIDQYEKIGQIYEQLGITYTDDDGDDDN
jgi:hypothetical protein